jgi:6-phosphogluconolactonase
MSRYVYIGTYTYYAAVPRHDGLFVYRLEPGSGELVKVQLLDGGVNPSFLAFHPHRSHLYTVNEIDQGAVTAFTLDASSGKLKRLNQKPTFGSAPCYLTCDPSGNWLLVANYSSGNLTVLPLDSYGRIGDAASLVQHRGVGMNKERQEGPHAHCVIFDPSGRFVLAADLGIDQILVYRLDAKGQLLPHSPPGIQTKPGAGPRHLVFSPSGRHLYASNELDASVTAYAWDGEKGTLSALQSLPTEAEGLFQTPNQVADIHLDPSGRHLYVSNRGPDTLAIFQVDPKSGTLAPLERVSSRGKWPRNFAIDPSGAFLLVANQNSGNLVVLPRQAHSGLLAAPVAELRLPAPVCVKIIDL